jgi:hypothetical protein
MCEQTVTPKLKLFAARVFLLERDGFIAPDFLQKVSKRTNVDARVDNQIQQF